MTSSAPFAFTPPLEESPDLGPTQYPSHHNGPSTMMVHLADRTLDSEKEVGEGSTSSESGQLSASEKIAKLLNGKDKEWAAVSEKKGRLQLLDLPLDILKEIMKQVSHTSDLTSIAQCHSSLHGLAIPHIYSRFDIVWPDAHATSDHRTGVDALTYGLATLVMAEDVFGEAPHQRNAQSNHTCTNCGHVDQCTCSSHFATENALLPRRTRRGNYFAQYTRKFSLGNGPPDWVQEYMITKEGGKMLGTLVALAVARMPNLEGFNWDMPTGVLREVWIALASLGYRADGQPCRLERVWVRWHDNSDGLPVPATSPQSGGNPTQAQPIVPPPAAGAPATGVPAIPQNLPCYRVEHPTFSVLPPLRSLSVLEIDELLYVEEMSILIERSKEKLRELRVGIAPHAGNREWVKLTGHKAPVPSVTSQGTSSTFRRPPRTDGVLGILVSKISKANEGSVKKSPDTEYRSMPGSSIQIGSATNIGEMPGQSSQDLATSCAIGASQGQELEAPSTPIKIEEEEGASSILPAVVGPPGSSPKNSIDLTHEDDVEMSPTMIDPAARSKSAPPGDPSTTKDHIQLALEAARESTQTKLRLEILEFERVPLSIPVLQRYIDWSRLTSLTILRCPGHEDLWKALRRKYTPLTAHSRLSTTSSRQQKLGRAGNDINKSQPLRPTISNYDYPLNIKKLQTDAVSPALISFLKETLAPNSLEWLFLQASRAYESSVPIESIFKGPIRRHRSSLRKLLVDSEDREDDGQPAHNTQWRRWIFPRELLEFMTSGRMPHLREAGMALDYKDWHYFLQRLPRIKQLRSIYIPYIADHVHGRNLDSRELALQILDIAALRPDLQICYLGIQAKCFEILETKPSDTDIPDVMNTPDALGGESDADSEEDDDENENDNPATPATTTADADATDSDTYSDPHGDSEEESGYALHEDKNAVQLKLREILFYDDKVSIFKARHGRL